jgi:hypothetical protein
MTERTDTVDRAKEPITPGSIWRSRSRAALIEEIKIVSETDNRFVWLVEWVREGRRLSMSGESIRSGFALAVAAEPPGHAP